MKPTQILLVEDDLDLSNITAKTLESYGFEVTIAENADLAYSLLSEKAFSLVILDINLSGESGFEICREIRRRSAVPIIFVSARTAENDKVNALDIGGDDYLEKPYSLRELLSRVKALLRRSAPVSEEKISFGNVEILPETRTVSKAGKAVSLSLKEFDLLLFLAQNKGKPLAKADILSAVWGAFCEVEQSTVSVHIRWLREKLEDNPASPKFIKTVWGIGYTLEGCDEN